MRRIREPLVRLRQGVLNEVDHTTWSILASRGMTPRCPLGCAQLNKTKTPGDLEQHSTCSLNGMCQNWEHRKQHNVPGHFSPAILLDVRPPAPGPKALPIVGGTPHVVPLGKGVASSSCGPERTGVLHRTHGKSLLRGHTSEPTQG